ncbi:hypothetical protein [Streptomyces sp. NPDC048710]|uniref:hypothetical protein n=1 Tax=Streptomyces sp. NPDC048710 TaxID=3365586 RepID=UPI0037101EC1
MAADPVDALSAVVAEQGLVPVRVIWSEDARRPTTAGRNTGECWGVAEPAADGDVIREGPSAMRAVEKGTRVPAPHGRRAGGRAGGRAGEGRRCRSYGSPATRRSGCS